MKIAPPGGVLRFGFGLVSRLCLAPRGELLQPSVKQHIASAEKLIN